MINFNGQLTSSDTTLSINNRGFLYADAVFETLKIVDSKILFFEDHYFRLMASMRILRMEIPMTFTMEYLEEQILKTAASNDGSFCSRARISVFRNEGGYYTPSDRTVSFIIQVKALENHKYELASSNYEVELYKDFSINKQLLSSIKTTNRVINVLGGIFAKENGFQNCLLINNEKNVIEGLNGNLFMLTGNTLITPPIEEGCINGVMRKQILSIAKKMEHLIVEEKPISPFDLQKADELFLTNVITGIQPISKYRKKEYSTILSNRLTEEINRSIGI